METIGDNTELESREDTLGSGGFDKRARVRRRQLAGGAVARLTSGPRGNGAGRRGRLARLGWGETG